MKKLGFFALILGYLYVVNTLEAAVHEIIHGQDNRHNITNYLDQTLTDYGQSVAGLVSNRRLREDPDHPGKLRFSKRKLDRRIFSFKDKSYPLCESELRFRQEHVLPTCTGFLVGEDLLLTAAHCVQDEFDCRFKSWVFNYNNKTELIDQNNVYRCQEIVSRQHKNSAFKIKDYALIKLDRKSDKRPLPLRQEGKIKTGTPLAMIGHPLGLPLKVTDNAKATGLNLKEILFLIPSLIKRKNYFISNIDAFAGNSGSPVINTTTYEVEGMLIEGAEDFKLNKKEKCLNYKKKSGSKFTNSEKVFRIRKVKELYK